MSTPEDNNNEPPKPDEELTVFAVRPENTLRKTIGYDVQIENILTPEKIQECQEVIDKAHVDLFADAVEGLAALEAEYTEANKNVVNAKPHVQKIAKLSFTLKGRLEAIGLSLGFEVAKSLYEFSRGTPGMTPEHMVVLRKHLDVLTVILKTKLQGDGGDIGKEMLESLSLLIKKT